jgi:3-isopropylmalate dehydrogenase
MRATIIALPGDGIGPEVCGAGAGVLRAVAERFGHEFDIREAPIGGAALDAGRLPLPPETLRDCRAADAVMLGAVGGPAWSDPDIARRPEAGLLALRAGLGLFANLRPVVPLAAVADASPLRPERLEGVDLMVVRELTGGIYFGNKIEGEDAAEDVCSYTRPEVERIVRMAATLAQSRGGRLTSVDKANVLATSRLWRAVTSQLMANEFPAVRLEHLLVDAAAMHLLSRPADFDVMVTENMFGDILTDEASMLAGSLGLLPSASLGERTEDGLGIGLYEPIHGSAPDIAGKGIANPIGMIASVAMLLRHSLGLESEAAAVETAIARALDDGARTPDLGPAAHAIGTAEMTRAVLSGLDEG